MRFHRRIIIAVLMLALPLGGARADINVRPDVISKAPARITKNSAVLRGTIYSDAPLTDYGFEYGETGNVRRVSLMSINASPSQDVEYEVKDLKPETVYQAHIYAANANGVAYGEFLSFTTEKAGLPPALEQGEPLLDTDPDIFTIRIPFTSEQPLQTYSVLYGEKKNSVKTKAKCVIDSNFIVATITGMHSDMQIYYQARARNMYGETVSEVIALVLPALTPTPSIEPTPTPVLTPTPAPPVEPVPTPDAAPPGEDDANTQEVLPEDTEPEDMLAQSVGLAVRRAFFLPVARVSLMETLELARQADSGDMDVLVAGALEDMSAGQYTDALHQLGMVLARQADHVDALLLAGLVYLRVDQPELAAAAFEKAQAAAPVEGYAAAGLSLSMLARGDSGQAYEIALECEKMDPNDPALRIPRLLAVLAMERYADLLALAKSVDAQFDGHALALGAKCAALQALGRPEAAQAREAIAGLPQYTQEESYAKAAAYAVAGDAVTAAALLRQAGIADAAVLARCDGAFVRVRNHLTIMLWTRDYSRMFTWLLMADGAALLLILVMSVAGRPRRMHMWEMKQ